MPPAPTRLPGTGVMLDEQKQRGQKPEEKFHGGACASAGVQTSGETHLGGRDRG